MGSQERERDAEASSNQRQGWERRRLSKQMVRGGGAAWPDGGLVGGRVREGLRD
jgi:hypothetical protein